MANAAGLGGGRTGPYWRRQLGTTLPGERTGAELGLINNLRRKAGLPPLGGPVGENTRFAQQGAGGRQLPPAPGPGGHIPFDEANPVGSQLPPGEVAPPGVEQGGGPGGFEGPLPNPQLGQQEDVRARLLQSLQGGQHQRPTSREALLRFMMQRQQRQAVPGPARPILPPRQPLRRAQARPY